MRNRCEWLLRGLYSEIMKIVAGEEMSEFIGFDIFG